MEKLSATKFWKKLVDSGDNLNKNSFSARKLSALAGIITAMWLSHKYCNPDILDYVISAWLLFALLCLGIVTIEQVINLKNGNNKPNDEKTSDVTP